MRARIAGFGFLLLGFLQISLAQPEPPTELTVYLNGEYPGQLTVRWQRGGADSFRVYSAISLEGSYSLLAVTDTTQYIDSPLQAKRFYKVTAFNEGVESVPCSNRAGYLRIMAVGGPSSVATPFGLPLKFWDLWDHVPMYGLETTRPSEILGDQTNCGGPLTADRILRQDNGQFALRTTYWNCLLWSGSLETNAGMVPGRAYWYINRSGANRAFVLAGEVDTCGNYLNLAVVGNAYTPTSWRDARLLNRSILTSDSCIGCGSLQTATRVTAQTGGAFCWRRCSDGTWQGSLISFEPGQAYWIKNPNETCYYNYAPCGLASPAAEH